MKSTVTTQEAKALLDDGWQLVEFKASHHSYYIREDTAQPYAGYCRYLNKDVFDSLVDMGYTVYDRAKEINDKKNLKSLKDDV